MAKNSKKPGFFSPENLKSLFFLVLLVLCFRWSIASPYHVPTASMEPTIKVGDRLLAFKLSYGFKIPFTDYSLIEWSKPHRGDIIVFKYPKNTSIDYVKRVIGLPGDHVKVISNTLYINGEKQEISDHNSNRNILTDIQDNPEGKNLFREKLFEVDHWVILDKSNPMQIFKPRYPSEGEFVVPEDSYFVMGDNRDNSTDSRSWGVVHKSYIRGKALFVIWSMFSPDDQDLMPDVRFDRFGHWLI